MKSYLFLLLFFLLPVRGAVDDWLHDPDKGMEQAQKENKLLFILYTDKLSEEIYHPAYPSDTYAKERRILSSPQFSDMQKDIVPVSIFKSSYLGSSRFYECYKLFKDHPEYPLNFDGHFLADSDGRLVWILDIKYFTDKKTDSISCQNGSHMPAFLKELKQGIVNGKIISENLKKSPHTEGLKKASLLSESYKLMTVPLKKLNYKMIDEILTLDKQDTHGFLKKIKSIETRKKTIVDLYLFLEKTIIPLLNKEEYHKVIDKSNEYIKKTDPPAIIKQVIMHQIIAQSYFIMGDLESNIKYYKEAVALNPDTNISKNYPYYLLLSSNPEEHQIARKQLRQTIIQHQQIISQAKPHYTPEDFLPSEWVRYIEYEKSKKKNYAHLVAFESLYNYGNL